MNQTPSVDTPRGEIVGFSRSATASAASKKGVESRQLAKVARLSLWEDLPDGWRCGPDSPPGVGWVLVNQAGHRRFYGSRDEALAKLAIFQEEDASPESERIGRYEVRRYSDDSWAVIGDKPTRWFLRRSQAVQAALGRL